MGELNFYIVDVFAEKKFTGNQLAVFRDVGDLSGEMMQKIAREMNYSESTFIKADKPSKCGYDTRIFTPAEELAFAGHPTLGTAYIIRNRIMKENTDEVNICLPVGSIPVKADFEMGDDFLWMKQNQPDFIGEVDPELVAEVLSLEIEELDERFPVMEVSTGTPFIIVPLKRLHAVRRAKCDIDSYFELIDQTESKAVYFFAPEAENKANQIHARLFANYYGVAEDAATGSAVGCLAAWLAHHEFFGDKIIEARVEQGYNIGRESLLYISAEKTDSGIDINVGGRVQMVAEGKLKL